MALWSARKGDPNGREFWLCCRRWSRAMSCTSRAGNSCCSSTFYSSGDTPGLCRFFRFLPRLHGERINGLSGRARRITRLMNTRTLRSGPSILMRSADAVGAGTFCPASSPVEWSAVPIVRHGHCSCKNHVASHQRIVGDPTGSMSSVRLASCPLMGVRRITADSRIPGNGGFRESTEGHVGPTT